jgi:NAD(P)-dependent dehydrogenase (short-subunit alcohol dehydrogenase family)
MTPPLSLAMALATTKVALVTGAARGIGRAIALRLAHDGLDIAVNDVTSSPELDVLVQEIESKGRRSLAVPADISLEPEVEKTIQKVVQELGSLNVMVANAGIINFESFMDTTVENFDRSMAVNARGTMLCYKYAGKQMIPQGRGGRIIGACSLSGKQGHSIDSSYCASKFAIRGLTQGAAQELGKYGITVNAYAPGPVKTAMTDKMKARFGPLLSAMIASSAVNRIGTPEDIADLVSYLASDGASFVTGTCASVFLHRARLFTLLRHSHTIYKGQSVSINGGFFFD